MIEEGQCCPECPEGITLSLRLFGYNDVSLYFHIALMNSLIISAVPLEIGGKYSQLHVHV